MEEVHRGEDRDSVLKKRKLGNEDLISTEILQPPLKKQKINQGEPNKVNPTNFVDRKLDNPKGSSVDSAIPSSALPSQNEGSDLVKNNINTSEENPIPPPPQIVITSKHSVEVVREIFTFILFESSRKWKSWSEKKDKKLKMLMQKFARHPNKWTIIAKSMGFRRGNVSQGIKLCQERFESHIKSGIKKSNWTKEEDERIIQLHEDGYDWIKIHKEEMKTRSPADIEERWNSTLRMITEESRMKVLKEVGMDILSRTAEMKSVEIKVVRKTGDHPQVVYSVNLSFGIKRPVEPVIIKKKEAPVFRFRRPPPPPPLPPFLPSYRHLMPPLPPGFLTTTPRMYRPASNRRFRKVFRRKRKKQNRPKKQKREFEDEDEEDDDEDDFVDDFEDIDEREFREYSRSPSPETPFFQSRTLTN